ncbi:MAG: tyrosine-type recombinase/integrase [bacterium]|nr:tyrosine-type recombinase/integrase [bacterium]
MALAERYLSERRALGFDLRITGKRLLVFARFADERIPEGPLTVSVAVEWARAAKRASPITWARRLEIVRPFARYLRQFDPVTEVPASGLLGRGHRRLAPHVYSQEELLAILREARKLSPMGGLRPAAVATVLGLLACTGLRVSEALKLHRDDVDLETAVLRVRVSKFRKSRLVPIHHTAASALRRYAALRDLLAPHTGEDIFFLVDGGVALSYSKLRTAFRRIRIRLGWEGRSGRRPRMHDLRHAFACHRLLQWHQEGVDVDAHLLDLSTYLGHAKVTDTYWYLSGFPELMNLTAQRFERFARSPEGVKA